MSLLFALFACAPATTSPDDSGEPTDTATVPETCEPPSEPRSLDGDNSATARLSGARHYYALDIDDDDIVMVELQVVGVDAVEGDAPIVRLCSPQGEVLAWAQGTPFWYYRTSHRTVVQGLVREGGSWGIEVVAPDEEDWDYTMLATVVADGAETMSTQEDPKVREMTPGAGRTFMMTFAEQQEAWLHLWTSCEGCVLSLVGGMGSPGSAAVGTFAVYRGDSLLAELVDPASESGGAEVLSVQGPLSPGEDGGLTIRVGTTTGETGPDMWLPFYVWAYVPEE